MPTSDDLSPEQSTLKQPPKPVGMDRQHRLSIFTSLPRSQRSTHLGTLSWTCTMNTQNDEWRKQDFKPENKRLVQIKADTLEAQSICSVMSRQADATFFDGEERASYTNSNTWKSPRTQLADDFARIQRLVRHIAPEQFRNPARPTNGPCNIVPQSLLEYVEHTKDILKMKTEQMEKNMTWKKEARRLKNLDPDGKHLSAIASCFGKGAKVYADGLSPVLCLPTMWSAEHDLHYSRTLDWPTQPELQEYGDRRESDRVPTRCGRYLPPPKELVMAPRKDTWCVDRGPPCLAYNIKKPLPLDEHGPIFSQGPTPIEIITANAVFDNDPTFEARGRALLGEGLMSEIGEWQPPFVPDWIEYRRQHDAYGRALMQVCARQTSMPPSTISCWTWNGSAR